DLQITGGLVRSRAASSAFDETCCAVFDARGNRHLQRPRHARETFAGAQRARRAGDRTAATTRGARPFERERDDALLHAHPAATRAGVAPFDATARFAARPRTALATIDALISDFLRAPENGFFEAHREPLPEIAAVAGADAECAEQIAE